MIYSLIGRSVVKFMILLVKRKIVFRTVLITGAGVAAGVTALGVAGYLATRDVPEG